MNGATTMSAIQHDVVNARAGRRGAGAGVADWLALAAAPTFALMGLLTSVLGGAPDLLCAMMQDPSPVGGMATMYLLMSAFHAAPWLRLISHTRPLPARGERAAQNPPLGESGEGALPRV